jgi:hypothetical protein
MTYTFEQVKEALNACTACDLQIVIDEDDDTALALIDPCGDIDGDLFYDIDDVVDYITNNEQVSEYLFGNNN